MTKVSLLFLYLGMLSAEEHHCPLIVRVASPEGQLAAEVLVSVREESGRTTERFSNSTDVRFCDLGILPVTVTVGLDGCNQVVIKDVPLIWQREYLLRVIYDYEPCGLDPVRGAVPSCEILLRISDREGNWIPKAMALFNDFARTRDQTDAAGRIRYVAKGSTTLSGIVSAAGYVSKRFSFSCGAGQAQHEERLRLDRS